MDAERRRRLHRVQVRIAAAHAARLEWEKIMDQESDAAWELRWNRSEWAVCRRAEAMANADASERRYWALGRALERMDAELMRLLEPAAEEEAADDGADVDEAGAS